MSFIEVAKANKSVRCGCENHVRCGCEKHDLDLYSDQIVVVGNEQWGIMCALRASTRVIDELRTEAAKASQTTKKAERLAERYHRLIERLQHRKCDDCGYWIGPYFEVCGDYFFCPECYNRMARFK